MEYEYSRFVFENINPRNLKSDDCVIRAIAKATGLTYHDVYVELCSIGLSICELPNSEQTYEKLLAKLGWTKHQSIITFEHMPIQVYQLVESKIDTTMIISTGNYLTCAINGSIYDLWDCRFQFVKNYWTKN